MRISFHPDAWAEYKYWVATDRRTAHKINKLIDEIIRDPFRGLGKPEPLKHELAGYWSRRIDHANRLVYKIELDAVLIAQCRYHY